MTQGNFPNELKIARVIPLYKGEDTQLIENYRPFQFYLISPKYLRKLCLHIYLNF